MAEAEIDRVGATVNDEKIHKLLPQVSKLLIKHGGRSEELRQFIKDNEHVGDFKSLAFTLILISEDQLGSIKGYETLKEAIIEALVQSEQQT